jgi:hypothetical protein
MTITEEYATAVAALGRGVWQPENDDASKTGHATTAPRHRACRLNAPQSPLDFAKAISGANFQAHGLAR